MTTTKTSRSSRKATSTRTPPDWEKMIDKAVSSKVCLKTGGILIIPAAALCDAMVDAAHKFLRGASPSGQPGPAMAGPDQQALSRMMLIGHIVGFCAALDIEITQERAMLLEHLDPQGSQELYAYLRVKKAWPEEGYVVVSGKPPGTN